MPSAVPSSAVSATVDMDKATRALAVCIGTGEKAAHGREHAQQDVEKVNKSGNRADGGVGMIFVACCAVGVGVARLLDLSSALKLRVSFSSTSCAVIVSF